MVQKVMRSRHSSASNVVLDTAPHNNNNLSCTHWTVTLYYYIPNITCCSWLLCIHPVNKHLNCSTSTPHPMPPYVDPWTPASVVLLRPKSGLPPQLSYCTPGFRSHVQPGSSSSWHILPREGCCLLHNPTGSLTWWLPLCFHAILVSYDVQYWPCLHSYPKARLIPNRFHFLYPPPLAEL